MTLINRGRERGEWAERLLGLPVEPLAGFSPHGYSIVVNATPCGWTNGAAAPFPLDRLEVPDSAGEAVLVDLPYGPESTPLVAAAAALGWTVIDGREVLLIEAHHQFELMTGQALPPGSMAEALAPVAPTAPAAQGAAGFPPAASGPVTPAGETAGAGAYATIRPRPASQAPV